MRCIIPNQTSPYKTRLHLTVTKELMASLKESALKEERSHTEWAVILLKRALEKYKLGDKVTARTIDDRHFEQIRKFIALLSGEETRNNISFAMIGQCLDLDPGKLKELYLTILSIRGVPDPPPGYKWKLVKDKEVRLD